MATKTAARPRGIDEHQAQLHLPFLPAGEMEREIIPPEAGENRSLTRLRRTALIGGRNMKNRPRQTKQQDAGPSRGSGARRDAAPSRRGGHGLKAVALREGRRGSREEASAPERRGPGAPEYRAQMRRVNAAARRAGAAAYATAETMSKAQREISVSEFFAKNRHLLGFDNKRKALLTTVKEAVDNSLDACEEAGILPDLDIAIEQVDEDRFRVRVRDNGPGIVKQQIPNVFGKLLYGSKFHRLKMSRGQQGIGISAAGMYGLLTTGKSVKITSRTGPKKEAHYYEIQIDTKKNQPTPVVDRPVEVNWEHGTEVEIELVATYTKGRQSVDEYLELTAIANPHAGIRYRPPSGDALELPRATNVLPPPTHTIRPHPYGVELGVLIKMLHDTKSHWLSGFLSSEFSRVSPRTADEICKQARLNPRSHPRRIARREAETLYNALQAAKLMNPPTNCLSPIGERQILAGLLKGVKAEFFTATTRPPAVYRGNPFLVEAGLAYGGELGPDPAEASEDNGNGDEAVVRRGKVVKEQRSPSPAKLMRFANRVPLLHQLSGCCIYKSVIEIDWRRYGLPQPGGNLPQGPLAIFVHLASVWVPFTSEGKEAIADYDEIRKEIKLAVQDCARKLQVYLNRRKARQYQADRRSLFERYIGEVVAACAAIKRINQRELTGNLLAIAKKATARADEQVGEAIASPAKAATGKPAASGSATRCGAAVNAPPIRAATVRERPISAAPRKERKIRAATVRERAAPEATVQPGMSAGEYGENTIVVDRAAAAPGPLFGSPANG